MRGLTGYVNRKRSDLENLKLVIEHSDRCLHEDQEMVAVTSKRKVRLCVSSAFKNQAWTGKASSQVRFDMLSNVVLVRSVILGTNCGVKIPWSKNSTDWRSSSMFRNWFTYTAAAAELLRSIGVDLAIVQYILNLFRRFCRACSWVSATSENASILSADNSIKLENWRCCTCNPLPRW